MTQPGVRAVDTGAMQTFIAIIVLIVGPVGLLLLLEHDVARQAERAFAMELRRRR